MGLADIVLRKALGTGGARQLFWGWMRRLLIRTFNDPSCSAMIHGRALRLPLSHELPAYLGLLPLYDKLPERLGTFLHNTCGPIKCLDVGANIGDTIAAIYRDDHDRFLAVEPNAKFNRYLRQNWNVPNVEIVDVVCSSSSEMQQFKVVERFGTASFIASANGLELQTTTVDDLLDTRTEFDGLHLIKVDTDGNDFAVLAGAQRSLRRQPAVLFESDVFGNRAYVADCLETIRRFGSAGYESFLVYEKFGYPLGRYRLDDLSHFRELLLYQLTKRYTYFDILFMKEQDLLAFREQERSFFVDTLWDPALRATARDAWQADV